MTDSDQSDRRHPNEADHERMRADLAKATAVRITALVAAPVRVPAHRLIPPGPEHGACARCSYPADHPVHQ